MNKFYKYNIDEAKQHLLEMYFGTDNPSLEEMLDVGTLYSSVAFNFIEYCTMQKAKGKKYIYICNDEHPQNENPNPDNTLDLSNTSTDFKWDHGIEVRLGGTLMYSSSRHVLNELKIYYLECHDYYFPHAIFVYFE
jgi:hypothetical protein